MTLYEFNRLDLAARASNVFYLGTFLASCPGRGNLYNMGDFFAEVLYNQETNDIQDVRSFRTTRNLEPYLDNIKVDPEA